jgi:hypothetical protein
MATPRLKRLSLVLVDAAARLMPPRRQAWAEAMHAELAHIPDGGEAMVFAVGCLWTACLERITPLSLLALITRFGVAAVTLYAAALHVFAPLNMLAVRIDLQHHGLDGWAGRAPLFHQGSATEALAAVEAIPSWQGLVLLAQAAIFVMAAWALIRWRPRLLAMAVGLGLAINTASVLAMLIEPPMPYLFHPVVGWLEYLPLVLLLAAGSGIWMIDREARRTAA